MAVRARHVDPARDLGLVEHERELGSIVVAPSPQADGAVGERRLRRPQRRHREPSDPVTGGAGASLLAGDPLGYVDLLERVLAVGTGGAARAVRPRRGWRVAARDAQIV